MKIRSAFCLLWITACLNVEADTGKPCQEYIDQLTTLSTTADANGIFSDKSFKLVLGLIHVPVRYSADAKTMEDLLNKVPQVNQSDLQMVLPNMSQCHPHVAEYNALVRLIKTVSLRPKATARQKKEVKELITRYLKPRLSLAGGFIEKKTQLYLLDQMIDANLWTTSGTQISEIKLLRFHTEEHHAELQKLGDIHWPASTKQFETLKKEEKDKLVQGLKKELEFTKELWTGLKSVQFK